MPRYTLDFAVELTNFDLEIERASCTMLILNVLGGPENSQDSYTVQLCAFALTQPRKLQIL